MPKKLIRKLQTGFGVSLLILVVSSSASFFSIKKQVKARERLIRTQQVILSANQILIDLQNAETGQRGYFLTNNEMFLDPYHQSAHSLPQSLKDARDMARHNEVQVARIDTISALVQTRLNILTDLVNIKRSGESIPLQQLEIGKMYMDSCRNIIARFVRSENQQMQMQSEEVDSITRYTSVFIILAAILSLVIAIVFYSRIHSELNKREKLQEAVRRKDAEILRRVNIIQKIAKRVSAGDYSVRVKDYEEDDLGEIAAALNTMIANLECSFDEINRNEWRQTGLAMLNETLVGNKTVEEITEDILANLVNYGECLNGAIYLFENEALVRRSSYGLEEGMKERYLPGEGIVGQVFLNKQTKLWENIESSDYVVSFASGQLKLSHILWVPLLSQGRCYGVIELGATKKLEEREVRFYEEACKTITLEIVAAHGRKYIQTLLEESQALSEELQAQHSELENLNTELEAQTQKLQASEEELKVQQEELLQSNHELEERSKLLEEKNTLIASSNLEIRKKAEELARTTRYKSEFLANMSHELRTPLNSILLLSRLMVENASDNLTPDQIESARVIQSSGSSLLSLIDEILDLSKIEAGKMELEYQPVSISSLCKNLNDIFAPVVDQKGLGFRCEIDDNLPDMIETDQLRLEQVLRNLLANAIKFTEKGGVSLRISRDPSKKDFVLFSVKDTGIGISEEHQQAIFEAFRQADGSTRRKFGGTGLGLSISREITRLLGGEITLESKPDEGSVFTLGIPLSKATADTVRGAQDAEVSLPADVPVKGPLTEEKGNYVVAEIPEEIDDDRHHIQKGDKVILIVEDDTHFAEALLNYTRQRRYKGIVLVRGDLVLSAALRYQPIAILLDIRLPVMDGWEVMDGLKSNPKTRHIPVHIMSSLEAKKESLMKGAMDFISKPLALEQIGIIFQKIEQALARNPRKVLIVEENSKHATALSYFLSNFNIPSEIKTNVDDSVRTLLTGNVNCVILDMAVPDKTSYETLEAVKQNPGLENLPIIIFTGKNLSQAEEVRIRKYADSIVIKTVHSFQRILDEVGLFLHLVEEGNSDPERRKVNKMGSLGEILKGKTILVADDDVRNIFSLSKTLEIYQMKVISAINGKEALEKLNAHPEVSAILMDMMMPEMDGYETIRQIRAMPAYARIPIISITAKAMMGDREKCIRVGASDYISKPVDKDQLLSLLRVWLYES